ncbi:hypothetical protein [Butyricicoccus sp. Marseille-Q5471]|uniref:hypothetical protein n=1 Tax=Butyricicoccus sp. Marseille-Q5471 TaxID=3039493 RepID=UPI0024BD1534|nr:hypothetical protein [Butyricicoccus sp. Marseille-Q5471]
MRKKHVLGFFDELLRTPAFVFLCAMFLCGALAGGMTGLIAGEGDDAIHLAALLSALPEQAGRCVLGAVLWIALPVLCALLRPVPLFLAGLCAARGFVLALTVAVGIGQKESLLLSVLATGLPAVLAVPALLAACTMVWCVTDPSGGKTLLQSCRIPYVICIVLAALSALLRVLLAAWWLG